MPDQTPNDNTHAQDVRSAQLEKMEQIVAKIREIYDSGTPLFTKKAIRNIMEQIDDIERSRLGKVSIEGIDGTAVQFKLRTGEVEPSIEIPGAETV
jgi:hypothetical protein